MGPWVRCVIVAVGLVLAGIGPGLAGNLTREALERYFPAPLAVGEREAELPVWPIYLGSGTRDQLAGYAFESIDFAPIPGFSGSPANLLVALAPDGTFLDVRVLDQHEPVFLHGLGPAPLDAFVRQYEGKSIAKPVKVVLGWGGTQADGNSAATLIDGVAKATASVRIINESVVASALEVARAKLGGGSGGPRARPRADPPETLSWAELVERGWVRRLELTNGAVEAAFADSAARGLDPLARTAPQELFAELWVAYLGVPTIGHSLLGEVGRAKLRKLLLDGDQALWIGSRGRWSITGDDFVPGSVPDRIAIRQAGLPIEARDFVLEPRTLPADAPAFDATAILQVPASTGLDPGRPWEASFRVTRAKGQIYPELVSRDFTLAYELPDTLFERPAPMAMATGWRAIWADRAVDIAILVTALALLTTALLAQNRLTAQPARFAVIRWTWLAFCLFWLGWWAQGQLSVVNLVGLVKLARGEGAFESMLYDPMTFIVLAFTVPTLLIWGRGTFCGWLCPFGALQEAIAWVGQRLRIRQRRVPPRLDAALRKGKYAILGLILAAALVSPDLAERLAEVEPFKTAITLVFVRSLPFVLYAVLLLAACLILYKPYCRYVCPLGAGLALGGLARRWDWLARREACGSPCRLCEARCRYGAIERSGRIRYDECFQCMDCVVIHNDARQCVPLVLAARRRAAKVPA